MPPLRDEMVPGPLRAWLADIRDLVGCPLEVVAAAAIVALAALVGREVGIRLKRFDSWKVIPNLGTP